MNGDTDFGWGSTEPESSGVFEGGMGSALLVVASGVYCAAIWLASGLQPLPYLAARARAGRAEVAHGVKTST